MALPAQWARSVTFVLNEGHLDACVFWWIVTGTPAAGWTPTGTAGAIDGNFKIPWLATITNASFYQGTDIAINLSGVVYDGSAPSNTVGGVAADGLPAECATVVRKMTAIGGRSGRGRWFLPAVPETFCTESKLTNAAITAYTSLVAQFLTIVVNQGLTYTPAHHSAKNVTLTPISAYVIDLIIGHVKRRRPRR